MSNLFDDFFDGGWMPRIDTTAPAVNVKETENAYEMEVASPGLKKDFCRVNLNEEGNLVVRLEGKFEHKDENKKEHYLRREFSYSNFEQSYLLPKDVDKDNISARVEDGILHIAMPKVTKSADKVERAIDIA
ncbi:MAG: Hsp20 family protein [Prevotella sp.]|nr:Hsp20 family protein [Prevotella sp.]MCD8306109.1 Hsp20 family protein [Prevotella sp.]